MHPHTYAPIRHTPSTMRACTLAPMLSEFEGNANHAMMATQQLSENGTEQQVGWTGKHRGLEKKEIGASRHRKTIFWEWDRVAGGVGWAGFEDFRS